MSSKTRTLLLVGVVVAVLMAFWLVLAWNCPSVGIAVTSKARNLHRLKNRTAFPQESDFDLIVTLDELLRPGDDSNRWAMDHAGRIQGEVIDVAYARPEATNCFSLCRRDLHILVANRAGAAKNEHVVVEVTPNLRPIFETGQGKQGKPEIDWSEQNLQAQLIGHWCEFEGWLYFDVGHADQSENTAAHNPTNWRATAWELHPVTKIMVLR
jgi:hypothetical protein